MVHPTREFFGMPKFIPEQYPVVDDFACVEIYIPNDPEYLYLLQGLVAAATKYWNYSGAGDDRKVRANLWQAAYDQTDWGQCMECEDVADCIENNEAVQAAIAAAIESSLVIQQALINQFDPSKRGIEVPGWYREKNTTGGNTECDLDMAWGNIREGLINRSFQRVIDVLEQIEAITDNQEMLASLLNAIPVVGALFDVVPATDWVLWFDNVRAWMRDQFEAGDTTELRDEIACDLFCLWQVDCSLSIQQIADYYQNKTLELVPSWENAWESMNTLIGALAGSNSSFGSAIVYALVGTQYGFQTFINDWFGITIECVFGDMGLGEPSDDWEIICDDCPTFWSKEWDLLAGLDGWTVSAGTWVEGDGVQNDPLSPNPYTVEVYREITMPDGSTVETWAIEAYSQAADLTANRGVYWDNFPTGTGQYVSADQSGEYTIEQSAAVPVPVRAAFTISNAAVPGNNTIRVVRMTGTGDEPTW